MKKVNIFIIYVISLISFLIAIKDFNIGKYDRLLGDLSILFVFIIPRIINKIFRFKISDKIEFIYIIFIIISQFLGSVINLFNTIWWYDLFSHFVSGILTGILALIILNYFNLDKNKKFNLSFIIIFTIFIAASWEYIEFLGDKVFNMNVQHSIETGVNDTMEDMLIATLGGILAFLKYLFENNKNGLLNKFVKKKS